MLESGPAENAPVDSALPHPSTMPAPYEGLGVFYLGYYVYGGEGRMPAFIGIKR